MATKLDWEGDLLGVQPRIRLRRSFSERAHTYLGYVLRLQGTLAGKGREFLVAVGEGAQRKHKFQVGDRVSGQGVSVADNQLETADLYKVSGLKVVARGCEPAGKPPPFQDIPSTLKVYRQRGHRRLDAHTFAAKCTACMWGCAMAVEMIVDQWNPSVRRYRRETFCYGPKSCVFYKAGPTRKVPGRKSMTWEEEDWVDADETAHRGPDD